MGYATTWIPSESALAERTVTRLRRLDGPVALDGAGQVVGGGRRDRQRDGRLDDARRQPDPAHRRDHQRDRVRQRERGHHGQHVAHDAAQGRRRLEPTAAAHEHAGQEQRDQEADVVEAAPDVPDALDDEPPHRRARAAAAL